MAAYAAAQAGGGPMYSAIAHTGAWINLFNLLPVWQLDGNCGFAALPPPARGLIALLFAAGWLIAHDGLFVLLAIAAAVRAVDARAPAATDRGAFVRFALLILSLAVVCRIAAG